MSFDEWLTEPSIIELARATMGSIDFDPASNIVAQEYVKAGTYCSLEDKELFIPNRLYDGLKQEWHGNVWLNPPYSRDNIDAFVDEAIDQWHKDKEINLRKLDNGELYVKQMMILVNSATDARWYHMLLKYSNVILLWRGRIKFWKIENGKAHEKWIGQVAKEKGSDKESNSPRYLNTMFYMGNNVDRFKEVFKGKGTFLHVN